MVHPARVIGWRDPSDLDLVPEQEGVAGAVRILSGSRSLACNDVAWSFEPLWFFLYTSERSLCWVHLYVHIEAVSVRMVVSVHVRDECSNGYRFRSVGDLYFFCIPSKSSQFPELVGKPSRSVLGGLLPAWWQ